MALLYAPGSDGEQPNHPLLLTAVKGSERDTHARALLKAGGVRFTYLSWTIILLGVFGTRSHINTIHSSTILALIGVGVARHVCCIL